MNIKNFIKTNWIYLSALVIILVIIITLLSLRAPSVAYRIKLDQVAAIVSDTGNQVSPIHLFDELSHKKANPILVDIRSSDEYAMGHIENAVNIPVRELLQAKSISFFKELKKSNTMAILYGQDQLQANGPWMLLKQIGYDNVKVLQGGYAFYKTLPLPDSIMRLKIMELSLEKPQIDTALIKKTGVSTMISSGSAEKKTPEKVIPSKKQGSTGGGC